MATSRWSDSLQRCAAMRLHVANQPHTSQPRWERCRCVLPPDRAKPIDPGRKTHRWRSLGRWRGSRSQTGLEPARGNLPGGGRRGRKSANKRERERRERPKLFVHLLGATGQR
jgi:hypothetical protein